MSYAVTITAQAEADLRSIFEYIAFDLHPFKMRRDSFPGWEKTFTL
jgi:plasmid stabilization system protein ParE